MEQQKLNTQQYQQQHQQQQQQQQQQMSNQQQMAAQQMAQQHQQQLAQQQQLVQQQHMSQAQQQQLSQAQQQQLVQAQQQHLVQSQHLVQAQQQQLVQVQQQQMAQQQIAQQQLQQQLMQQQQMAQQQMMLCPIRVVYETPMLMQQGGDQMQQNQAIFLNPQNPPPWARPVQNQVIYVQQVGNNIVPVQQGIDPNMLMQQNFVYPQMINMNQGLQEIRQMPVQLPNVIHPNVIQNIQQNNMNDDRPVLQMVVDNSQVNQNISANQITVQNSNNRQMNTISLQPQPNIHQSNQNPMTNVKPPDLSKQIMYRQVVPQNQTMNRPQMMINQMSPQMRPMQTQTTNVRQTIQQPNLVPNTQMQQTFVNMPNVKIEKTQSTDTKSIGVPMYTVRNPQSFGYRTIQPRPMNRHLPNLLPMGAQQQQQIQNQFVQRPIAPVMTNNTNNDNYTKINNTSGGYVKTEPNGTKKRKSESPEVVQKKMPSTVYGSITVTPKLDIPSLSNLPRNMNNSSDVGVNTSPVHKPDARAIVRPPIVPQNKPNTSHMNVNKEILNKIARNQTDRGTESPKTSSDASMQTDKDKLVRNTVFTQARGRVLSDNKPNMSPTVMTQGVNNANVNRDPRNENKVNTNMPVVKIENEQNNTPPVTQTMTPTAVKDLKQTPMPMEVDGSTYKPEPAVIRVDSIAKMAELTSNIPDMSRQPIESNNVIKTEKNSKLNDEIAKTSESIAKISALAMKMNENSQKTTEIVKPKDLIVKLENSNEIKKLDLFNKTVEVKLEKTDLNKEVMKLTDSKISKDSKPISKESKPISKETKPPTVNTKLNDNEVKPIEITSKVNEVAPMPKESVSETEKPNVTPSKPSKMNIANQIQSMTDDKSSKIKDEHGKVKSNAKNRKDYKNIGPNDMKGKEIQIVDGAVVKDDKDYILTHVLDGYVIQESNVPFAIRKPLTEKVIPNTPAKHEEETVKKEVDIKSAEIKENVQDAKALMELSSLNIDDGNVKDEDVKNDENDNPFNRLKPSAVKLWTVDQLSLHLSKHNWMDTISILQEHEIDGESLFLASKPQLIAIGVSETHADLICEFVKS